jgi:LPPG:FO 2-phospho-L-lactate transferase
MSARRNTDKTAHDRETWVALTGGVGGAKLALGLARVLAPDRLTIVVNTGDDFEHLGLHIAPDIDTTLYTLAGIANPELGWGRADETWSFMAVLERLGGPTWFKLGDRDLALHVERTRRLKAGAMLSAVTAHLAESLGVGPHVVPMSDDPVRTVVETDQGPLAFQDYFVGRQCAPRVTAVRFAGADCARPAPGVLAALADPGLAGVILCPSNPWLSVDPILAVPGMRAALRATSAPVVAVAPIIAGQAVKGPTAKIMAELGLDVSVLSIVAHYRGLIDGFVLDAEDRALESRIGLPVRVANTRMRSLEDRIALAEAMIAFCRALGHHPATVEGSAA